METHETAILKHRKDMPHCPLSACHGGDGDLDWVGVLGDNDLADRRVKFVHDDVLAPGVSIGLHEHSDDEEYYFIVSGSGTMTLNDERVDVSDGDIAAVFPGGKHALENTGNGPLRIIVFSVATGMPNQPSHHTA